MLNQPYSKKSLENIFRLVYLLYYVAQDIPVFWRYIIFVHWNSHKVVTQYIKGIKLKECETNPNMKKDSDHPLHDEFPLYTINSTLVF